MNRHYDETFKNAVGAELASRVRKAAPARVQKRTRLFLGAGALGGAGLLTGTAFLVTASAPTPPDRFMDASRIITTLSEPQRETDRVPLAFQNMDGSIVEHDVLKPLGVDPANTRRVGQSSTLTYYAAPADGDKICIVDVVTTTQTVHSAGCTALKSFESFGLKSVAPDGKEAAWLIVPAGAEKSLESVANEPGWKQQAPNFLIREN
ncbi:hypothetical protein NtRootA9_02130 [Arthrobacter sp. NtRootA9]|nr:hypothetical protein NtRootA9_02130 [Arthrobacter sp. NtRootA9]